jgi:long-chain acyl-CoA synthetase
VLRLTPADTLLSCFPLHTVLGQTCALNAVVAAGACLSLPARFDPSGLTRVMTEHGVTVVAAFPALLPTLHRAAESAAGDLALRAVLGAGGAPVPGRWRNAISEGPGCELLACYGPPEAAALVCATAPGTPARPGSVGTAVAGMEIRIGDANHPAPPGAVGELLVRGDHVMAGYWDDQVASEGALRGGWLRTGQSAQLDDEGWVYLADGGWVGRLTGPRPGRRGRLRRWWGRSD